MKKRNVEKIYKIETFRKLVFIELDRYEEGASEKETNKMRGFFIRALKPHKAKIKLDLLDY